MKAILSALVAFTVLAGVVAPASAADNPFDAKSFFESLQNTSGRAPPQSRPARSAPVSIARTIHRWPG
jgi:hypothetical protein